MSHAIGGTEVQYYSVMIEADSPPISDDDVIDELIHVLALLDVEGASVTAGAGIPRVGATFSLQALSPLDAIAGGFEAFTQAVTKAGIRIDGIAEIRLQTEAAQERELQEPPETFVGLSEIADILGVSKQRVGEIREKPEFPKPIAELRAGPVWSRTMLDTFIEEWPRRRTGRPRKLTEEQEREKDAMKAAVPAGQRPPARPA